MRGGGGGGRKVVLIIKQQWRSWFLECLSALREQGVGVFVGDKKNNGIIHVLYIKLNVVGDDFHGGTISIHLELPVL